MASVELFNALKERFNGSELIANNEKGSMEDLFGKTVTVKEYDFIGSEEDHHFAVTFAEEPGKYFNTGSAMTELLDIAVSMGESAEGVKIAIGKKTKTKSGHDYTPITVVE